MATRGKSQKVKALNADDVNTRKISEGQEERRNFIIDDQWASSMDPSAVSHCTLTSTKSEGFLDFLDIGVSVDGLQEFDSGRSLVKRNN